MVTHGAKGGLLVLLAALVEPGDEVIHPLPCYPAYPAMVRRFGGVPMGVAEHGDGFAGWSDAGPGDRRAEDPRGRALITVKSVGDDHRRQGAGGAGRWLRRSGDPTRSSTRPTRPSAFGDDVADPAAVDAESILVRVGSASKSLALPGWRVGWIVADEELVARVTWFSPRCSTRRRRRRSKPCSRCPRCPTAISRPTAARSRERLGAMVEAVRRAGFDAADAGGWLLSLGRYPRPARSGRRRTPPRGAKASPKSTVSVSGPARTTEPPAGSASPCPRATTGARWCEKLEERLSVVG